MKTDSKNITLVLIQDRIDFEHYQKCSDRFHNDRLQIIALTPVADYLLERSGLPYRTIEEFYDDAKIASEAVESNLQRLEDTCLKIDVHLQNHLRSLEGHDGFSIFYSFFGFKILHDNIFLKVSQFSGLFDTLQPHRIVCRTCNAPAWYEGKSFEALLRSNQLYSILAPWIAKHRNIEVVSLTKQSRLNLSDVKTSVKYLLTRTIPGVLAFGFKIKNISALFISDPRITTSNVDFNSKPLSIFADAEFTQHFEVDVAVELMSRSHSIASLDDAHVAADSNTKFEVFNSWKRAVHFSKRAFTHIVQDENVRKIFAIGGIDFSALFFSALERAIELELPASYRKMLGIRTLLQKAKNPVVLTTSGGSIEGRAAVGIGVPALIFQHGGGWGYLDMMPIGEYRELFAGSHYLCSGAKTAEKLRQNYPFCPRRSLSQRPQVVPIGIARIDALRRPAMQSSSRKLRVMVLVSNLYGDFRYFTNTLYPDIKLWRMQRDVLRACQKFDVDLMVKLYPKSAVRNVLYPNPLQDWIDDTSFSARIERNSKYSDLLNDTDLVIMDSCQTTFLEALAANKAVVTLADRRWMNFYSEAKELLPATAFVADSFESFIKQIETCLSNPSICSVEETDNRFLKAYGNHLDDGHSAKRAADFIESFWTQTTN